MKENWAFSTTWPAVHIQLQSSIPSPFSPTELCPVLWIAPWRCVTLVSFWLSKGAWGGIQTAWIWYTHFQAWNACIWIPGKMDFTQITFLSSTFSPYFPCHPKKPLNSSTFSSAILYITFDKLVLQNHPQFFQTMQATPYQRHYFRFIPLPFCNHRDNIFLLPFIISQTTCSFTSVNTMATTAIIYTRN